MNKYEIVLMFYPDVDADVREKHLERLKKIIEDNGSIQTADEWGNRKLAYEIEYYNEAYYVLMEFEAQPEAIKELARIAGILDTVMLHMIVRVDE